MIFDSYGNMVNDDGSKINAPFSGSIPDPANETISNTLVSGGASDNYVSGKSGWSITRDGNAEFNNSLFRGTITNGSGMTIMDSSGLVSTNNFKTDSITYTTQQSTNSASYVDVTGSTMNSFTLTRSAIVYVWYKVQGWNDKWQTSSGQTFNSNDFCYFQMVDSVLGVLFSDTAVPSNNVLLDSSHNIISGATYPAITYDANIVLFGAGTHTLKMQYKAPGGNSYIDKFSMGYTILGI